MFYIRYLKNEKSVTHFAKIVDIPDGEAHTIKQCIVSFLKENEIPLVWKWWCNSYDWYIHVPKEEFATQLKQDIPPWHMLSHHCVAHRLALVSAQAVRDIAYVNKFKNIVEQPFRFYHKRAVRTAALKETQSVLND
jgi:predicted ATP-grasp superfamily ATP-dependent carboligase